MNGIDYAKTLNRQREIYQQKAEEARRNKSEEVDNLKKAHEFREKQQVESHGKQLKDIEESHVKATERIKKNQAEALVKKNAQYEESILKAKDGFHKQKKENLQEWDKRYSELRSTFQKNIKDKDEYDQKLRENLKLNYKDNIKNIRKVADKDLNNFVKDIESEKNLSNYRRRIEQSRLVEDHQKEKNQLLKNATEERNFLKNNAVSDGQTARSLATSRYIDGKNEQENKFRDMTEKVNNRIDSEIVEREDRMRTEQTGHNKLRNKEFKKRYNQLSEQYNKDVQKIAFQKRAEGISQNETNKEIQKKYKDNLKMQSELKHETNTRERNQVEERYSKLLEGTVQSYQKELKEEQLSANEKIVNSEARHADINRQDKYDDRQKRERMMHDHNVALKYVEQKNASREADVKASTNRKVNSLKQNFNKSMEAAREQSQKNFALTRQAMLKDKELLAKRLHEQNSQENAQIKGMYQEKMAKQADGYEKKIKSLEVSNKLIADNAQNMLRDVTRKTNMEIERQRKAAQDSAKSQVETERELAKERENSLKTKLQDVQKNFEEKMNKQTITFRKKIRDVQFESSKKMQDQKNKYKDIMEQNNKFMAREFQRLKIASDSERQRLINQYEDRIAKLQRVYKEQTEEREQFSQLNQA